MLRTITAIALTAALVSPALAQQTQPQQTKAQQTQATKSQAQQTQAQQGNARQQGMSQEARACIDKLEQTDQQLAEVGYGRVGPGGYGVGAPVGRAAPPATTGSGTLAAGASTPRGDMQVLMRAGYIMAMNGYGSGCQEVAKAADGMGSRYAEAVRSGDVDPGEMRSWRAEFLNSAVLTTSLDRPLSAEEIIGADLRNTRDEDLGDIDDVVFGADGQPHYVIVSTDGFLGLGEDQVPVRWQDLRVTAEPYRDTFVLNVSEQAFDDAPRLEGLPPTGLMDEGSGQAFDTYWDGTVGKDRS